MQYIGIFTYQFIPCYASAIHKNTHTRILKPFEDSEPTGLKVDIANSVVGSTGLTDVKLAALRRPLVSFLLAPYVLCTCTAVTISNHMSSLLNLLSLLIGWLQYTSSQQSLDWSRQISCTRTADMSRLSECVKTVEYFAREVRF